VISSVNANFVASTQMCGGVFPVVDREYSRNVPGTLDGAIGPLFSRPRRRGVVIHTPPPTQMNLDVGVEDTWHGAAYQNIAELQRTLAMQSLSALEWDHRATVVDLGCGDGAVTAEIAARVPDGNVLGIDQSADQIDFANANCTLPNLTFTVGDAATFEISPPRDVLTSFNALHWVHDLEQATGRIYEAIHPGGFVLLRLVGLGGRTSLEQVAAEVTQADDWVHLFTDFRQPFEHRSPEQWTSLLTESGFKDVTLHVDDISWEFGSRENFASWCSGTFGVWTNRLPEERRQAFINDVLNGYEPIAGKPGLFRFLQFRITTRRPPD
jgi:trans-aconitate 2-methyltransferase